MHSYLHDDIHTTKHSTSRIIGCSTVQLSLFFKRQSITTKGPERPLVGQSDPSVCRFVAHQYTIQPARVLAFWPCFFSFSHFAFLPFSLDGMEERGKKWRNGKKKRILRAKSFTEIRCGISSRKKGNWLCCEGR